MSRRDGYRFVRSFRSTENSPFDRWTLYEVNDCRARKVGVVASEAEYRAFLAGSAA